MGEAADPGLGARLRSNCFVCRPRKQGIVTFSSGDLITGAFKCLTLPKSAPLCVVCRCPRAHRSSLCECVTV